MLIHVTMSWCAVYISCSVFWYSFTNFFSYLYKPKLLSVKAIFWITLQMCTWYCLLPFCDCFSALHFEDRLALNYTHITLFSVCFETALSINTLPDAVEHVTGVLLLVVLIMV